MTSPTQRSLKYLKDSGYYACVVEKWIPFIKRRKDAFDFGDILATHPSIAGPVLVQTTTQAHRANRQKKAKGNGALVAWLLSGGRLAVHGWRKIKRRWAVDVRFLTMGEIVAEHENVK